jgi:hypothetical protein
VRWPGPSGTFEVYSGDHRLELSDFSASGLGVVSTNERADFRVGHRVELELRRADLSFARLHLQVTSAVDTATGCRVGGRIVRSFVVDARQFSEELHGDAPLEVTDGALRALVIERLGGLRARARLTLDGVEGSARVALLPGYVRDSVRVRFDGDDVSVGAREGAATLEASLLGAHFILRGSLNKSTREWSLLSPMEVFSTARRSSERVPIQPGHACVEWWHPLDPSRRLAATVRDISPTGLSIEPPKESVWFLPPPGSTVELKLGERTFPIRVEARRTDTLGGAVGLQLSAGTVEERILLARVYQSVRCPSLKLRGDADALAVSELMHSSGYTSLRSGAHPVAGWGTPPGDERLTLDLVHHGDDGSPSGHVSSLRVYRSTWMYHQLATLQPGRTQAAYRLYLMIAEWVLTLSNGEGYAIAYFNQAKRWHQTMFTHFTRWTRSPSMSTITSLDRLEPSSEPHDREWTAPNVSIRPARAQHRDVLARLARASLPPLVADALDLHEDTVLAPVLCAEHEAVGLARSRTGFVAEVEGQVVGAALCELGSRTLSLFNILNMAFVFFRHDSVGADPSVQATLLASVRRFYLRRGISDPIIVVPSGMLRSPDRAGLTVVESMGLWAASAEGLKQWRNYIHLELGFRAETEPARGSAFNENRLPDAKTEPTLAMPKESHT